MTPRLPTPVFPLESTVYQRTAPESAAGTVTGLLFRPSGGIIYLVMWSVEHCAEETSHWACELTADKSFDVGGGK